MPSTHDTHGNPLSTTDPSVSSDASLPQKLSGDTKGAVKGTMGSAEAATGTAIGSTGLKDKGFEKMSEEDHRLAAKHGVPPVGSGMREGDLGEKSKAE